MADYQAKENNDILKIKKSYKKLTEENVELADRLDYITKEEMIANLKKLAKAAGIEVNFTYDNLKNKI
ncbi:MAG: hypothetical protein MI740_10550 [Halanaerobiales bacterium]|nr:hypothetical protein [Halanaerobiales bacterium]